MPSFVPNCRMRLFAPFLVVAAITLALGSGTDGQARDMQVPCYLTVAYPGDTASRVQLVRWLGAAARAAGIPPELPVMAALADSGLRNRRPSRSADSAGYFQMRTSIWSVGEYRGFATKPQLQLKWFLDSAIAVKMQRYSSGAVDFGKDAGSWGEWIADVERPAEQLRGRYQLRLEEARSLLKAAGP